MSQSNLRTIDRHELPWYYRLILKIPGADFLQNTSSGIFWTVVVPVFFLLEFFLNLYLLVSFPFPANVILVGVVPGTLFLIFVRISLERFLNWWNLSVGEHGREWNVEKHVQEYLGMLKEKKQEKDEEKRDA